MTDDLYHIRDVMCRLVEAALSSQFLSNARRKNLERAYGGYIESLVQKPTGVADACATAAAASMGCDVLVYANHDAAPAARAPADSHAPRGAVDRESVGTDKAEPLTRDCGTGDISEAQIDALECVVEDGRIVGMSVYGHLRSLLVRLRPEWEEESDRSKPVKDDDSDRSKPINDNRLSALEELSAMDQELELKHGMQGNPMIKAQRNKESAGAGITDAGPRLRQMNDVLEENERLRGQLAWTERERDSLRVSINNLRDYVAELNAELYAKTDEKRVLYDTKRDTTPPRNGALSDGPDPDSRVWPCTPSRHATQTQGSVQGEGNFRVSRNAKEPVAWAVAGDYGDYAVKLFADKASAVLEADRRGLVGLRPDYVVVPLYRHPQHTLNDEERQAVEVAETNHRFMWQNGYGICDSGPDACGEIAATLRGLLERTK